MVKMTRPSPLSRTLALVPPVVVLVAQHASGSIFLKVETTNGGMITGESLDTKHTGWIDVSSTQFGIANTVTLGTNTGGISAGKSVGSDLNGTNLREFWDKIMLVF